VGFYLRGCRNCYFVEYLYLTLPPSLPPSLLPSFLPQVAIHEAMEQQTISIAKVRSPSLPSLPPSLASS